MLNLLYSIFSLLNQNIGLITLIVGFFVFVIYKKQKAEYKRDAAMLILQEIRYAEQQLRIAKDHNYEYHLFYQLLPTNSWNQNINLFIKNLKESEIDLISKFYSQTSYIDKVIETISDYKNSQKIPLGPPVTLPLNLPAAHGQATPTSELPQVQQSITLQDFKLLAEEILKDTSKKTEFIYNTPAVDKLRCISEKKWYDLF